MILTGPEIKAQVEAGAITIDPFLPSLLNPNSYNYRLGSLLGISRRLFQDPRAAPDWRTVRLLSSGFLLEPGHIYLGNTCERIGSDVYVASLMGRSSVGRLGLYLQLSADLGQLGQSHHWTLELKVVQPLRVYPRMRIGQVSFWRRIGDYTPYQGRYMETDLPTPSRLWHDY